MSGEQLPLAGAVAGLRMLVDGTIAVTMHFEPKDRTAAMQMLGEPGAMVGVVRLKNGAGAAPAPKPDPRGPLCMEAIGLCNNADFQAFVARNKLWRPEPEAAKGYILATCGIDSRKEIDGNTEAQAKFRDMQQRYRAWLLETSK